MYNWLTFSQLKSALATRLSDPSKIFWIDSELGSYLKESLRTWNLIAQYSRDRTVFNTQPNLAFYDLTSINNPNSITGGTGAGLTNPSSMLGYSIKERDLINDIEYCLIEPITSIWSSWSGTDQFTMDDLTRAIERRRNLFLLLVGSHISHLQVVVPPGNGLAQLSDSIQQIRRASWKDSTSYIPIYSSDEDEASNLTPNWVNSPATPSAFSSTLNPLVLVQLIPPPLDTGTLDLLTINNPPDLDESVGTFLNIPDDCAWIVKFGALADLLGKDGQAFDPTRSEYCEKRFLEGIRFAQLSGTILTGMLDGNSISPCDISELDLMVPSWQNLTGSSTDLAIVGRNLICLSPVPNSNQHSIQLDIIRNMPIPSLDSDKIQLGKESIDAILDYATHLAFFKVGGAEFQSTVQLADRFMQQAMLNNDKLRSEARNYSIMQGYSKKEEISKKRFRREKKAA